MEKKSDEIWKKIVFEKIKDQVNHLYVSNLGRIKSSLQETFLVVPLKKDIPL
jgi:hypothetical protein